MCHVVRPTSSKTYIPQFFCAYPGQSIRNQATYLPEWKPASQGTWREPEPDRQSIMNSSILSPLERLGLAATASQYVSVQYACSCLMVQQKFARIL
jgi:hypothetical protein